MGIIKDLNDWERVQAAYSRLAKQPNHTSRDLELMQLYQAALLQLREKTKPVRKEKETNGEETHHEF